MKWLSLRVGGKLWSVYLVSERHPRLEKNKGITHIDDCQIYICRDLPEQTRDEILLHELLHAIFYVTGAAHEIDCDVKEEAIVRDVTPTLHRLLVDLGFRFPKGMAS